MPKPKRHHLKAKYRSGLEKQTALVLSECQKKVRYELLNDDHDGIYEEVKTALEDKVERLLADNQVPQDDKLEPTYTAEGNVLRLNAFTRTKGSC